MVEDGVAAATTRRIAGEAGATLATVHYCFESKQALLREVITTLVRQLATAVRQPPRQTSDLTTLVREYLDAVWQVVEGEPKRQRLTYELTQFALREPDLAELAQWQYRLYHQECEQTLGAVARAANVSWILPVDVVARMVLSAMDGAVLGWLVDGDAARSRQVLLTYGELLAGLAEPVRDAHPAVVGVRP